jgi:AcrR family transcriptional regulator
MKDNPSSRSPRRPYTSSLRERQAGQTRELILSTAAELIAQEGLQALSVAEVARQAGVSLRTVWRNFANLDEMIDALDRRAADMGPTLHPSFDELDAHVVTQFDFFEANSSFILSSVYWRFSQNQSPPARSERLRAFLNAFEQATPGLQPDLRRAGEAALALLPNAMAWAILRKEFDWSSEEAGRAVGWILQLVVDELRRISAASVGPPASSEVIERRAPK